MISKIGFKKLKNDTISTLINIYPESIEAKNKKINSIEFLPPLVLEYDWKGEGDWIFEGLLQFYYKKQTRISLVCFKNTIIKKVLLFETKLSYLYLFHHLQSLLPRYI